jgi:hypothetical protein
MFILVEEPLPALPSRKRDRFEKKGRIFLLLVLQKMPLEILFNNSTIQQFNDSTIKSFSFCPLLFNPTTYPVKSVSLFHGVSRDFTDHQS